MAGLVDITVRLIRAVKQAYARKWRFLAVFAVLFAGAVYVLAWLDLLPDAPPSPTVPTVVLTASSTAAEGSGPAPVPVAEFPASISIPTIGLTATIANPTTTNVDALDALLLKGAVRYPTSAMLGETGNVILFGHSSYLPVVGNPAYKTFDGIQKLVAGNVIVVYSSDMAYTYRVRDVAKESANDAIIPLSVAGQVLTLSTCNSFGAKTDRFVVTADFVESHPIADTSSGSAGG